MNAKINSTIATSTLKNFTETTSTEDFWTIPSVKMGLAYAGAFITISILIIASMYHAPFSNFISIYE